MCVPSWAGLRPGPSISPRLEKKKDADRPPPTACRASTCFFRPFFAPVHYQWCVVLRSCDASLVSSRKFLYLCCCASWVASTFHASSLRPPPFFLCFALPLTRGLFTRAAAAVCGCNGLTARFSGSFPICFCSTCIAVTPVLSVGCYVVGKRAGALFSSGQRLCQAFCSCALVLRGFRFRACQTLKATC